MTPPKTRGQIERALCQQIQALYRDLLGQYPHSAISRVFDRRLIVLLQDTSPQVERFLHLTGQAMLAEQMNREVEAALKPRIKAVIEEILQIKVVTLLLMSDLEQGFSCVAALLEDSPNLREKISKPSRQAASASDQSLSSAS